MVMSHLVLPRRQAWSCVFPGRRAREQAAGGLSFKYVSYFLAFVVPL